MAILILTQIQNDHSILNWKNDSGQNIIMNMVPLIVNTEIELNFKMTRISLIEKFRIRTDVHNDWYWIISISDKIWKWLRYPYASKMSVKFQSYDWWNWQVNFTDVKNMFQFLKYCPLHEIEWNFMKLQKFWVLKLF